MVYAVLLGLGLLAGMVIGRWWSLVFAVAGGLLIATTEEVEVPGYVLGIGYTGVLSIAIVVGVSLRHAIFHERS